VEATDEGRQGEDEAALTGSLVLVGGPIASGKSTLARAVARRLRDGGTSAGVVDVDQVYEMLEERGHSPGKTELWHKAHRLAGRMRARSWGRAQPCMPMPAQPPKCLAMPASPSGQVSFMKPMI
jgi:Adenylylsulphate kinase